MVDGGGQLDDDGGGVEDGASFFSSFICVRQATMRVEGLPKKKDMRGRGQLLRNKKKFCL